MSAETIAAIAFLAFAIGAAAMMFAFAINIFRDGEEMRAANRAERERRKERVNIKWEIGSTPDVADSLSKALAGELKADAKPSAEKGGA